MSFTHVGVHHEAQHQLHQNLRENQEDARVNFFLNVEERVWG